MASTRNFFAFILTLAATATAIGRLSEHAVHSGVRWATGTTRAADCVWVVVEGLDHQQTARCVRSPTGLKDAVRAAAAVTGCVGLEWRPPGEVQAGRSFALRGDADGACTVATGRMSAEAKLVLGLPLLLNEASVEDLQLLPGIGPALAWRIAAARAKVGGFLEVDDLLDVRGIGPARLAAIRAVVAVDERAAASGAVEGVQ